VNLAPAKAVASIGDLIRLFASSSHGGIATENQRLAQVVGSDEAHKYMCQLGVQIEAVVGGS
jgi:hypothetical protein